MDQARNKSFARILSRSGTNKSSSTNLDRTNTGLSSLGISDDEKGDLGLSTLYEPTSATSANIIFIHGLGGGSRKTWSFSSDLEHFWPLRWLPEDPDFRAVRILSFGYKADWGERNQSVLNIHDFAQSLLGELRNHPSIRRERTRMVLVGHSMGGCVAKKAYIIARQDPACKEFAERLHSIFFLGTPHRGSDLASVLESMLLVAWGRKPFVTDLVPNSTALTEINDAFRHFAPELRLWSFYETLPVKARLVNKLVVEKASATLGYANEEIAGLNADHRQICKFEDRSDPNFRILRNALHTAIDLIQATSESPPGYAGLESTSSIQLGHAPSEIISRLRSFLGLHENVDEDFTGFQILKEPGSCLWFSEGVEFTRWKSGKEADFFWLTGKPASGKSILSSHVIDQLKSTGAYCSYFFFKHGKIGKSSLSDCLRSLVFQMATYDDTFRERLLRLETEGTIWDKADEVNIWRKMFASLIFQLPTVRQHVWVIDALDESSNFGALFSKRLLSTTPSGLRLFITSRDLEEIGRGMSSLGDRVTVKALSEADTLSDMRLLKLKFKELDRLETDETREAMTEKILQKSSGSFLWVRLVLQEFENAWTQEAMEAVLDEIPADLYQMYTRMVQTIELDTRNAVLAKSILAWVVLASRPLALDELRCAVKLDIQQTIQNMEKAIPSICGQLVSIDKTKHVHMIHETAREFLLSEAGFSQLAISKIQEHTRLASLTLRYLSGDVLRQRPAGQQLSKRARGFRKQAEATTEDSSLLEYASRFFSDHIYKGTSENDELMEQLSEFLSSDNVLAWIERIARDNMLSDITRTAMNLRGYLGRRIRYVPPTDPSVNLVDSWIHDFIRLAAKFRLQLLACPSAIYCLVPPLCPSDSIIARTFAKESRKVLDVSGLPRGNWDDCLIRIDFHKGQTVAVRHGVGYFAVGLSTGQISLYNASTFQQVAKMKHPERIRILEFGPSDELLVSISSNRLMIWDPKDGSIVQSFPLQSPPLAATFLSSQELICAFQSGQITKWDFVAGDNATISWKENDDELRASVEFDVPDQPPSRIALLTNGDDIILAVGYRNHPVFIWDALDLRILGRCGADFNNGIDAMVFNPNPDIVSLAVSYNNGTLCLFDYSTMEMTFMQPYIHAHSLACSPDGRTLATGSNQGSIEIFEFDQDRSGNTVLSLIHRIDASDNSIRSIAFNYDGLQFVDVRGQQCRVWAPAALVRRDSELETTSDAVPLPPKTVGMLDTSEEPEITSPLVVSDDGSWVIAGKSTGAVVLLSSADGSELGPLYHHAKGVSITSVVLGEKHNLVISADDSGRVLVARITAHPHQLKQAKIPLSASIILDRRVRSSVVDIVLNASADRLLLTRRDIEELWEIPSGVVIGKWPLEQNSLGPGTPQFRSSTPASSRSPSPSRGDIGLTGSTRKAIQHPSNSEWFIIISRGIARVFSWADFTEHTTADGISLIHSPLPEMYASGSLAASGIPPNEPNGVHIFSHGSFHEGPGIILEHHRANSTTSSRIIIWPAAVFNPPGNSKTQSIHDPHIEAIQAAVDTVIGFVGTRLLFLDANLWVCSCTLPTVAAAMEKAPGPHNQGVLSRHMPQLTGSTSLQMKFDGRNSATDNAQTWRHFFALSEWRTISGYVRCALGVGAGSSSQSLGSQRRNQSQDIFFATTHRLIVVKGGLEFSEEVELAHELPINSALQGSVISSGATHYGWKLVSGNMSRRGSNW